MIDPASVCLFVPPGLRTFKLDLFTRIANHVRGLGGSVAEHDYEAVRRLPPDVLPIVGCTPQFRDDLREWRRKGRQFIYWDRGYARRVFATWLPRGENGGYYRWHLNSEQMQTVRDVPSDRWDALRQVISPWRRNPGGHIEVAAGSPTYERFHGIEGWVARTCDELRRHTRREIRVSDKETKIPLADRIRDAHAVVSHGSNAAVEAAIMGCPVFVDPLSAAALVGRTDLSMIEEPVYPDRGAWARSLAYSQFDERELVDGTLWRLMQ